jgi:hypothetical protein
MQQQQGLQKSKEDHNMYFSIKDGNYAPILLYVDETIITGDDHSNVKRLIEGDMTQTLRIEN